MLPGCPSCMRLYPLQWHGGSWCPDIPTKFLIENILMWGSGRERCAGRLPADKSRLSGSCSALQHSLGSCKKQTTKELCDVKPTPFEYHLRVRAFPLELCTDEASGPYRREKQHRAEQTVSACHETQSVPALRAEGGGQPETKSLGAWDQGGAQQQITKLPLGFATLVQTEHLIILSVW